MSVLDVLLAGGDAFAWDGKGPLMDRRIPASVAALYLIACVGHNSRARKASEAERTEGRSTALDAASVAHNVVLVAFSSLECAAASYYLAKLLSYIGFAAFLCPSLPPGGSTQDLPPLGGPLHWWCYIFYLSKYYELVDTALLMARGKRIIPLHAIHHAFIPYVMCVLFDGRVSISLVSLSVLNSFVHVVMYSYYLASALGLDTPFAWKRAITRLQILQFLAGVVGGSGYWLFYVTEPELRPQWPYLTYVEGCGGGEPTTVVVGYVMNCVLLFLFLRFYRGAYRKREQTEKKGA